MKETYGEKYNHCLDMLQNYIRCLQKNNDIEKAIDFQDKLYLLKKRSMDIIIQKHYNHSTI